MGSTGNPNPWGTYDSYRDCSQGVCSVYCPQWCYVIFPPPPSFYLDDEDDSSSSDFSPLLIALIGILASAFILVSYYTLISKYCNRRRNGSSGAITRDRGISSSATDHWQGNNGATNTNPVIGEGLDESLIKSITVYKYKKGDGFVDSSDCSVCLSEFQENESLKLLPKCNHAFHVPCIDTWLQSHSNCPLCRAFIAGINVTAAIEIVPVSTQPISVHQIDAESAENNATSTDLNHQNGDSVVVSSDLESRLRNETVINGVSTPKPPEVQESRRREEQVERRSASVNSGAVVSIADILREMEDEEDSAGVGTSRRLEEGEGEKTPPSSGSTANQTSGISNFLVRSSVAAMKRSVSTAFTTEKRKNEERLKRFVSNQNCRRFGPRESFFRPHTRLVQRAKLNSHNVVFGDQSQYVDPNPGHSIEDIYEQVFGKPWDSDHPDPNPGPATMSGFAQNAERKMQGMSSAVMNGFKPDALPVYKELVQNFAICDRWFASVPASTHPNRLFVHSATSYGSTNNDKKLLIKGFPQKTIFESLSEAGLTFAIYYQSLPTTLLYRSLRKLKYLTHFHDYGLQFKKDCKEGKLPNYVVVEQRWYDLLLNPANDDHPSHDVSEGQNLVKEVYEALRSSPQWNQILFIITYDEHGGFYDHVPTPVDGVPNPDGILGPPPYNFEFNRLGVRVPTFFISPWIEPGTVLHKPNGPYTSSQYEHSSIPATIKKIFNLTDFLTKRDSWAGTFESAITRDSPRQDCPETLSNPVKLRETVAKENAELSDFQEEQIIMAAGLKGDYKNEELIHKLCKETCVADASKYVTNAFEKFLQDSKEARERGCDENDIVYCVDDECYETTTISIRSIACDF